MFAKTLEKESKIEVTGSFPFPIEMEDKTLLTPVTGFRPIITGKEGTVYLFEDEQKIKYAVKERLIVDNLEEAYRVLENEMKFVQKIHGYCSKKVIFNKTVNDYSLYLAMPWVEGNTLKGEFTSSNHIDQIVLLITLSVEVAIQLHDQKISHNDLNDTNVMVNQQKKQFYFIDLSTAQYFKPSQAHATTDDQLSLSISIGDFLKRIKKNGSYYFDLINYNVLQELKIIETDAENLKDFPRDTYKKLVKVLQKIEFFEYAITPNAAFFLIQSFIKMKEDKAFINDYLIRFIKAKVIKNTLTTSEGATLFRAAIFYKRYDLIHSWINAGLFPRTPILLNKIFSSCIINNHMATALQFFSLNSNLKKGCALIKDRFDNNILHFLFNNLEKLISSKDRKIIYFLIGKILLENSFLYFQNNINHISPKILLEQRLGKLTQNPKNEKEIACLKEISDYMKSRMYLKKLGLMVRARASFFPEGEELKVDLFKKRKISQTKKYKF